MLAIPDQHRQEHDERDQRREPGHRAGQPARTPGRHQHEGQHGRKKHDDGEFRQQRQPAEQPGRQPPARIAALAEPHQRPQHRDRERDHRHVGRHLGHQQPVIKRGLRHQHRQHHGADVVGHAPHHVGEQQLRDQHGQHAGKPHPQIGIAEYRGAETDEPRDHRRMIEEGQHALLGPGPVIGLVGAQIDHAGVDQPHRRHRGYQRHHAEQLRTGEMGGEMVGLGAALGRGNRHGAFSPARGRGVNVPGWRVAGTTAERWSPAALNSNIAGVYLTESDDRTRPLPVCKIHPRRRRPADPLRLRARAVQPI